MSSPTPPSLPRWFRAFALRVFSFEELMNVVQKPEDHRDKLGGVDCLRTRHARNNTTDRHGHARDGVVIRLRPFAHSCDAGGRHRNSDVPCHRHG